MKVIPGEAPEQGKLSSKAPEVVGIDGRGRLSVLKDGEVIYHKIVLGPAGELRAVPDNEDKTDNTPDQVGERKSVPVAARWAGCDQG